MKRIISALIFCFTLSSCSSQFAYNNLDWLAYWYIDDYVDLDREQKKQFDVHLEKWLQWHRKEELSRYKMQLERIRERLAKGPLTEQEILQEFAEGRKHWERLRAKLSPELSQFAALLNDNQVDAFFEELAEQNQEWEEELAEQKDAEKMEKRIENLEEDMKDHIGRLTSEQKQLIRKFADKFISNSDEWLKYRRRIQAEAKSLFEHRHENPEFSAELMALMLQPEQYRHEALVTNLENNRVFYASLMARISETLTEKQHKRLFRKLDNLIEDLQELIED